MKFFIAILIALILPTSGFAQNLIDNGSFESPSIPVPSIRFGVLDFWSVVQNAGSYRVCLADDAFPCPKSGTINCPTAGLDQLIYDAVDGSQVGWVGIDAVTGEKANMLQVVAVPESGVYRLSWVGLGRCPLIMQNTEVLAQVFDATLEPPTLIAATTTQDAPAVVAPHMLEFEVQASGFILVRFDRIGATTTSAVQAWIDSVEVVRIGDLPNPSIPVDCAGFLPPLADGPIFVKKSRVIPVKMMADVPLGAAPPIINVFYTGTAGGSAVEVDVTGVGAASDGNQFASDNGYDWQFNLSTKPYTANGTYTISAVAGDDSYELVGCTDGEFEK